MKQICRMCYVSFGLMEDIFLVVDSGHSSGPSSLEIKDERSRNLDKRIAVEERRKQLWEAEQVVLIEENSF